MAVPVDPLTVPTQTRIVYDNADRPTAEIFEPYNVERWRTSTYYAGDRTDTQPPAGGTATSTVTDARGRTVEFRQYKNPADLGSSNTSLFLKSEYHYNAKAQLDRVTDPMGNDWEYIYDVRGRKVQDIDPDRGSTYYGYDDADRLYYTVDSRPKYLYYLYDALNRKTAVLQNAPTGQARATWSYDTVAKGYLSQSVRYNGSTPYRNVITGYNDRYQPTTVETIIPSIDTGIAGTYKTEYFYHPDGSLASTVYPAIGDLTAETVHQKYDGLGLPSQLTANYNLAQTSYVTDTAYNALGQVDQVTLYTGLYSETGHRAHLNYGRELETGRTTQIYADREIAAPYTLTDLRYTYNDAGDVTKIADRVTTPDDTQCFTYDYLRRLDKAWTPTSGNCATAPTAAGLGGPAPYWLSWQYDDAGNRTEQIEHATPTGDKTTTYNYPTPGTSQPHRLVSTTTADSTGSVTANYVHDPAGNMTTRPVPGGNQVIIWDPEGWIGSATSPGGNTAYLNDADGNRLVNRETGVKTLFLPGQELRYTSATGAKVGTRYYIHGGVLVASRTGAGVTWLVADHQSTQTIAVDASTQAITQRRQTPFGTPRGTSPTWVNNRGFVGGIQDRNDLVHLGAREYDPALGRFLTVDPVFDVTNPQQWNGYTYAENSPITKSDPTGLFADASDGGGGGGTGCDQACKKESGKRLVKNTEEEITKTRAVANSSPMDEVKKLLPELAMELTPLGDIKGCFDGDLLSCLGLLPIGKAFKLIRAAGRIIDAFQTARRMIAAARARLGALQERLSAYQRYADEVGQAVDGCEDTHSFDPKTLVLMADGTTKPIAEVAIGDAVLATDPKTGKTYARLVTAQHLNDDTDLTDVVVIGMDGSESILKTTQHHPFWDETSGRWVDAGNLEVGHELRTIDRGVVRIAEVRNHLGHQYMRDLTIDQTHTYYVVAGDEPVLVHNCGVRLTQSEAATLRPGTHSEARGPADKLDGSTSQAEKDWAQEQVCHVCGAGEPGNMIADHQDEVTAFNPPGTRQNIMAMCSSCSADQSVATRKGQAILRNHGIYNPSHPDSAERLRELIDAHTE